jgi:outer membrane cobalamin receptor
MIRRSPGRSGRVSPYLFCSLLAWLMLAGFSLPLLAGSQADRATIRGVVTDPSGRIVRSADVLVLQGQSVIAATITNEQGAFGPIAVLPGTYDVTVATTGMRLPSTSVTLAAGATRELALTLALAAVGESIVVSASHVDTTTSRSADSITVVDRRRLADTQTDAVAGALRFAPGFNVTASGGRGALTSLFPRGGESDYTLVLVDGIVQNAFGGGFDVAHLATADVERIEIVRGPQSALFGGGAIGGIVQIVTAHGGGLRTGGAFETGGYGTTAANGSLSGSIASVTFGASLDWLQSDGDTRTFASTGGPVANDDYRRTSGSLSVGWSDIAARRVRVDIKAGQNERGFPGPYGSDPLGLYGGLDRVSRGTNDTRGVGVSGVFAQRGRLFHHAQFTWSDATGRFDAPDFFTPGAIATSTDETRRVTGRYRLDVQAGAIGVSAGAELLRERNDNTYITGEAFTPVPVERSSTGLFAEARPRLASRLFVNVGVRLERIERTALEASPGARPSFEPHIVWSANPKLSLAWLLREDGSGRRGGLGTTKLRVGAGTGIKPPTAFEIAYTDNPDLKPERSRSYDLGLEQSLAGSRVLADATFFHNTYDDMIVTVGSALAGASRYQSDNIANARARGLELGATWRPTATLSARGSWTWLDTDILAVDSLPGVVPAPYVTGDRLVRRPGGAGSADLIWSGTRGSAFVSIAGRRRMRDLEPNFVSSLVDNPGFVSTTIGASVRLHRTIEVYGRVSNAFDRSYEETFGYPAPGRTASIGVRVTRSR